MKNTKKHWIAALAVFALCLVACKERDTHYEYGEDAEWQAKLKKACDVARDGQSLMRKVDKEHARLRRLAAKS